MSDSATLWTVVHQAPLSMGFSRKEYWSWLLLPPPGGLPDPGIKPTPLTSSTLAGGFLTTQGARPLLSTGNRVTNTPDTVSTLWTFQTLKRHITQAGEELCRCGAEIPEQWIKPFWGQGPDLELAKQRARWEEGQGRTFHVQHQCIWRLQTWFTAGREETAQGV